jgi:hypothetical protein
MSPRRETGGTDSDIEEAAQAAGLTTGRTDTRKPRAHDTTALDEIELYAEVLSAVAAADHPLTPEELDEVLGLPPKPRIAFPVAIYLAIEDDHEMVEQALMLVLKAFEFEIVYSDPPVRGSWFRRFIGSARELASDPGVEKRLIKVERAIDMRLLLTDQANIDAAQGDAVAKLLMALENTHDALIQIGSVLLIKVDDVPVVRNLSQRELAYMEQNPALFRDPSATLQELQKINFDEVD